MERVMKPIRFVARIVPVCALILLPTTAALAVNATTCVLPSVSLRMVPLSGTLRHIVVDPSCRYVYISNTTSNRIEVFSILDNAFQAPIAVGSQPAGFDITADGSRLYVANSGGHDISVVDLLLRREIKRIVVPANPSNLFNDSPFSIAIADNGLALFSTTFASTGFVARMMQLNLTTEVPSQRLDFYFFGTTTEATYVATSGDRTAIAIVVGDSSFGPVFVYRSATNSFSKERDVAAPVAFIASDRTGSAFLVSPGSTVSTAKTFVLDATPDLSDTISGGGFGVAIDPSGTVGYRAITSSVETLDLTTFAKTGSVPLGDTVGVASVPGVGNGTGRMAISGDGRLLAIITDHGISLVEAIKSNLVSSVLPASRSVVLGSPATAFATIINAGQIPALGCSIAPVPSLPAGFAFQTTDPATNQVTGTPNTPVNIPAGGSQPFVVAFMPTATFGPTDVQLKFSCANNVTAPVQSGLNTLLLSASTTPVPDIVALAATINGDGIVNVPGPAGTGVFAVATVNAGAGGQLTASADAGIANLPVTLSICQTNPGTGECLTAPLPTVTVQIEASATPTFGIFVKGSGNVAFDPAFNRIFLRFKDAGNAVRGATSVAVRTQ